ncbi:hypothetical protein TCAL_17277 [Tigriopus californicus]|uniref:Uncharacterized protein n=1 Tax=Tigriopus californicus TaxID=6832 RepID=A0A553NXN9_TIGCA|nr:hypothetical protein TCAL_17277 [Tigriopus californicus]
MAVLWQNNPWLMQILFDTLDQALSRRKLLNWAARWSILLDLVPHPKGRSPPSCSHLCLRYRPATEINRKTEAEDKAKVEEWPAAGLVGLEEFMKIIDWMLRHAIDKALQSESSPEPMTNLFEFGSTGGPFRRD